MQRIRSHLLYSRMRTSLLTAARQFAEAMVPTVDAALASAQEARTFRDSRSKSSLAQRDSKDLDATH